MPKPSNVPIALPPRIRSGDEISADWGNRIRDALFRLAMRGGSEPKQSPIRANPQPFWPALGIGGTAESPTYYVTVTRGIVCDRDTSDADAVVYFEPVVLTTGEPTQFAITDTQSVCVHFETDDTGAITGTPEIVVVDSDQESIHYAPPAGSATAGTDGDYYYKLAAFAATPTPTLEMFGAGDNVDHYRELPMFVKAGGTADTFKEFGASEGKYKTRGISGGTGITVTENTDDIEVKLDDDGWWGLFLLEFFQNSTDSTPYNALEVTVEAGRIMGVRYQTPGGALTTVPGDEGTPGSTSMGWYAEP